MSNTVDALTIVPTGLFALFAALFASACDDPEDPEALASIAAADDEDEFGFGSDDAPDRTPAPDLQEAPPPKGFFIEKVTTGGKGCPDPGSVSVLLSADKTMMRVVYKKMLLKKGPGAVQTTSCTAALHLRIPAGWRVAPATLKTRGYAYLDKNIKARRNTSIFFAGVPGGPKFDTNLKGPYDDLFMVTDVVAPGKMWSSCGGSALLSVSTSLVLNTAANPGGNALLTLQDQRLLSWQFKKC